MEKGKVIHSKELLLTTGKRSKKDIIHSLMKPKSPTKEKLKTFKHAKSPLLEKIGIFLPEMKLSTIALMKKSEEEREQLNIENVEGCSEVVEMNLLLGLAEKDDKDVSSDSDSSSSNKMDIITSHGSPKEISKGPCINKKPSSKNCKLIVEIYPENKDSISLNSAEQTIASNLVKFEK